MFHTKYKSYKFGSKFDLNHNTFDTLISLFNSKNHRKPKTILTGRNSVLETNIPKLGSLIIKQYARGGFLSYFNKDKYIYSKKSRSELEFEALIGAYQAGVNVPEPIAYVRKGTLFYKAWLITKKIDGSKNFIGLCIDEKDKAISLLPAICENINKLIVSSIHHPDLHPGNIVIDKLNQPFILDFDKTRYFSGNKRKLAKKYKQRWQRAIKKYNLPDELLTLHLL